MPNETTRGSVKLTSVLSIIIGAWLMFSPLVYRAVGDMDAWNSWIFGALIIIFAAIRYSSPLHVRTWSVLNMLTGAWVVISPWIYGYTPHPGRFVNSLCVGALIFFLSAFGTGHSTPQLGTPGEVHH